MASTIPSINWKQCKDSSGNSHTQTVLSNNTINYGAVQAGEYSDVVCVRPSFTGEDSIGKVKFWLQTYQAKNNDGTETIDIMNNLNNNGWIMKYYVVNSYIPLLLMNSSQDIKTSLPKSTITVGQGYTKSVWQIDEDTYSYPMQPIPIAASQSNPAYPASVSNMKNIYNTKGYNFGTTTPDSESDYSLAYGGKLTNCNIAETTTGTNMPYIYLTIKPPAEAAAGNWNNFACRLSFLWPWDDSIQG